MKYHLGQGQFELIINSGDKKKTVNVIMYNAIAENHWQPVYI